MQISFYQLLSPHWVTHRRFQFNLFALAVCLENLFKYFLSTFKTNKDWHLLICKILLKMNLPGQKNYWLKIGKYESALDRSLSVPVPMLWNTLSNKIRQPKSDELFKISFKNISSYTWMSMYINYNFLLFFKILSCVSIDFFLTSVLKRHWMELVVDLRTTAFTTFLVQRQGESFLKFPMLN